MSARRQAWTRLIQAARPRKTLTHCQFAEQYITMPKDGPRGGERFNASWQPAIRVLWEELDKEHWKEVAVTGPVQASKSFGSLVVPTLRDVVELRMSPIVGVPEADMFADKWDKDFKPVFEASPELKWLMPTSGSGAKGGRVRDRVTLGNNVDIKVMSRGGQATNKAGYTSARLRITEAAGFSVASRSETDEEADAYRQLVARLDAFKMTDPRRLVMAEGTGTIEDHLPWRLRGKDDDDVLISTQSRLLSPCPHCEAWISPEREHLVGWKNATSALQALEQATFVCPSCGAAITDEQRRTTMQDARLVHRGQEIQPDGTINGPLPRVLRLWFRYSTWHNCLKDAGDAAVKEWEAAQIEEGTIDRENAERDLCQKTWVTPYKSMLADNEPLDAKVIRKRVTLVKEWQRGLLPYDTQHTAIGVDLGEWTSWWWLIAFRENGEYETPAYGAFDIKRSKSDDVSSRLFSALCEFNESVVLNGFPMDGHEGLHIPDVVGCDIGFLPEIAGEAIRSFGRGWKNRWKGMRGRGRSVKRNNGGYHHPSRVSIQYPRIGTQWFSEWNAKRRIEEITFNADYWLARLHDSLRIDVGHKGAMSLFRSDTPTEHSKASNHLAADQLRREWDPQRGGLVEKYVNKGDNHWGDAAKMAMMLGDYVGWRLHEIKVEIPEEPAEEPPAEDDNWYSRMARA